MIKIITTRTHQLKPFQVMVAFFNLFLITAAFSNLHRALAESHTNFKMRRFELCGTNNTIKLSGNVSDEKDGQYISVSVVTPVSLDENIGITCKMDSVLGSKIVAPLFTIREQNFCMAANKYLGEFWYDLVRAAQRVPGMCPLPAGKYHLHHVYMDYRKITLQTFPFGRIRFTMNWINNRKPKESLLCVLMEVDNIPN